MYNPFRKRASENVHESEAFLQLVSYAPIDLILSSHRSEDLFSKLVFLLGTPGSGKTTFGRLFEYRNLMTLNREANHPNYRELAKVLSDFGAISIIGPRLLAARLPMNSEYRGIWELPYDQSLKRGLFLNLLQSRCILMWINALKEQGIQDKQIEIVTNQHSPAAQERIGSSSYESFKQKAIEVESAVYEIVHALVPKSTAHIATSLASPYDPLSSLISFDIQSEDLSEKISLKPMLIVDDGHELHSWQFSNLTDFLMKRDLQIARWVMTRFDIATSVNKWIQTQSTEADHPGRQLGRDFLVLLTNQVSQPSNKRSFRTAAQDIANRYLELMPIFTRMKQTRLSSMLAKTCKGISKSHIEKLRTRIKHEARDLKISDERVAKLSKLINDYQAAANETEDVRLAMLRILLHRYVKRTPQQELFADIIDVEPKRELNADSGVLNGARLFLMHEYDRPYYYGIETLADAGNGNIEQFLRMADELVSTIESKLIRSKTQYSLSCEEQHKLIKDVATNAIGQWDFPMRDKVESLTDYIGKQAVRASLQPNAYLNHGANAYGVLQTDFEKMEKISPVFFQTLHYACAYNALNIISNYRCKNDVWTLFELGGYPIIKHGLSFSKGGFVEGGMSSLIAAIEGRSE